MSITLRKIEQKDNVELAELIRSIFREFNMAISGTVYTDPTTDHLFELFQTPKSVYWIAEEDGKMLGGGGIFPTINLPEGYVELVKVYLTKESRGKGIGRLLTEKCLESAELLGFTHLYLESFPHLTAAIQLYKKLGFNTIHQALGNSGHYACNVWMVKKIN